MQVLESAQTEVIAFSPLLRRYTLEEFWALPEPDNRAHYELIGGYLFMVPPPDPPHDDLDHRLVVSLVNFLTAHGMPGRVYHPRASIYLDDTYVEPDMMYVSNELAARMGERRSSADVVFEYLSKSTANYVRTTKADTYLALGVRELWLIDPETKTIEVGYRLIKNGKPLWERVRYDAKEWAESRVLAGWRVSVGELFAGLV